MNLRQVVKCVFPYADDYELFVQRQADAELAMPAASRVATGLLGKIHNDVGRRDIDQIFLRAKPKRIRVFALSVEPARRANVAERFKLLSA